MSARSIGVAQVGCGYWGPNLLRNLLVQPQCRVKWLVDASPERRAYVERSFERVRAIPELSQALEDPEVDAVVVATPASTHFSVVKQCLQAGKHVLVEKPVATSTEEADTLVTLAQQAGRILMVGHTFLYNNAVRYTRTLLEENQLGDLFYIYNQRLNLGQVRSDVNVWWNLAPHDVSILLYLMNGQLPSSVAARGAAYVQPGVADIVFATLTWKSGIVAHVHVSWLDPGKVRRVTLVGSRKMLVYDDVGDNKLTIFDKGIDKIPRAGERMDYDQPVSYDLMHRSGDIWIPKIDLPEPLRMEVAHFLDCVRTGETPLTGPMHARDVVAVLEAGERSLSNGGCDVSPDEHNNAR